jgi:hypothetical protein
LGSTPFSILSISSITEVFQYFGVYKRDLDPLNVTLLHLYFQNYIIIEEMEKIENREDIADIVLRKLGNLTKIEAIKVWMY